MKLRHSSNDVCIGGDCADGKYRLIDVYWSPRRNRWALMYDCQKWGYARTRRLGKKLLKNFAIKYDGIKIQ